MLEVPDGDWAVSTVGIGNPSPSSAAATSDEAQSNAVVTVTSTCWSVCSTTTGAAVFASSALATIAASSFQASVSTTTHWHTFTTTPSPVPSSATVILNPSSVTLTTAAKAGIGVSVTSFVFLFVFLPIGFCCWRRRRRRRQRIEFEDRPEIHDGTERDGLEGLKAELEDKYKGVHDIPDPRVFARRRSMPVEMEGHAVSLTSVAAWARAEEAEQRDGRNELDCVVRACEMEEPGIANEMPGRRKTKSGNEGYELARWGQTVDGVGREAGEV